MNKEEALEFSKRWLAAWTGNQPQKLLEFYHSNATYLDPARPQGLHGLVEIGQYFSRLLAKNPDWVWIPLEVRSYEHGFTLKWQAKLPGLDSFNGLDLVEIKDGKIIRNEVYFDTKNLVKA